MDENDRPDYLDHVVQVYYPTMAPVLQRHVFALNTSRCIALVAELSMCEFCKLPRSSS